MTEESTGVYLNLLEVCTIAYKVSLLLMNSDKMRDNWETFTGTLSSSGIWSLPVSLGNDC